MTVAELEREIVALSVIDRAALLTRLEVLGVLDTIDDYVLESTDDSSEPEKHDTSESGIRKALARKIIDRVVEDLTKETAERRLLYNSYETEDGELCLVFEGHSTHGYGGVLCHYLSSSPVEKILAECESIFERLSFTETDPSSKESTVRHLAKIEEIQGHREMFVERIAYVATWQLLLGFPVRLSWILEENFEESLLFAEKFMYSELAETIWGEGLTHTGVDSVPAIKAFAEKAAEKTREHLTTLLGVMPGLVVNAKGRPQEITTAKVRMALVKCGANDGIKSVASELGYSEKGIEKWFKSRGYSSWKETKEALEQN